MEVQAITKDGEGVVIDFGAKMGIAFFDRKAKIWDLEGLTRTPKNPKAFVKLLNKLNRKESKHVIRIDKSFLI